MVHLRCWGSRLLRRSTNGSGTTLTAYAFGLEEHVYSSSGTNQGNTYYYPLGGRLIGELNGSATQFLLTDALGSVLATVSNVAGSAAVQGNQVYSPYGKQRYKFGTLGTAKGFTGQYNDSLTGLDYYNARYYDPKAGVFLSADTVEGNGVGRDPYACVGGNPETDSDPSGWVLEEGEEGGGRVLEGGVMPGAEAEASGSSLSQSDSLTPAADLTASQGSTTYTYNPDTGQMMAKTENPDGSVSWHEVAQGSDEFERALADINAQNTVSDEAVNSEILRNEVTHTGEGQPGQPTGPETPPTTPSATTVSDQPATMSPNDIRFTQAEISRTGDIQDATGRVVGRYTVEDNIQALQSGTMTPDDFPAIRVFVKTPEMNDWGPMQGGPRGRFWGDPANLENGRVYSLDNRRLYVFQQAEVTDIPVKWVQMREIYKTRWHFDTPNGGTSIEVRP
jgi:RHS repeat-associated protein